MSCEVANDMLLVEHHSGESEMSDDEYERRLWPEDQLRQRPVGACLWLGWQVPGTCVVNWVRCTREREGQSFVAELRSLVK